MTRRELVERTRQLIAEGDRLEASPTLGGLRLWLKLSDDLLATAWGSRFVDVGAHGHINADAGVGPWPLGERLLDELRG